VHFSIFSRFFQKKIDFSRLKKKDIFDIKINIFTCLFFVSLSFVVYSWANLCLNLQAPRARKATERPQVGAQTSLLFADSEGAEGADCRWRRVRKYTAETARAERRRAGWCIF